VTVVGVDEFYLGGRAWEVLIVPIDCNSKDTASVEVDGEVGDVSEEV
jgi:hypothetical protein